MTNMNTFLNICWVCRGTLPPEKQDNPEDIGLCEKCKENVKQRV